MDKVSTGQVTPTAAEIYEDFFVPALFREWAPRLIEAAGITRGMTVLDIACGTGIVARNAREQVGPSGKVTGLDRNEGMLAVAQRHGPDIVWRQGLAESLPFADNTFDAVTCQFALMFFEDRVKALQEMYRVLRPQARMAIAVWDRLENSAGYMQMSMLLDRLFGKSVADALRAPFVLGDPADLRDLLTASGIEGADIRTLSGTARFPSIESWVHTDVKGWTLADLLDDSQYRALLTAAGTDLSKFVLVDGTVAFPAPAHVVTASHP